MAAWWEKVDQMLSKEPQKPGQGLDRASLIWAREKARPEETMAWPGSDWARPVFQASDIGNISVTARGQKSFLVAVSQPGPRQNFRMDSHPSTLAVGSQYTLKICRYPSSSRACVPRNRSAYWISVIESLWRNSARFVGSSLPFLSSVIVACLSHGFLQLLVL